MSSYVPYISEKSEITACGVPITYDASKEWANKKVVLFSVPGSQLFTPALSLIIYTLPLDPKSPALIPPIPGAFTPGCSVRHLPGFIDNLEKIKAKGVDVVAVVAYNDAFVMNAWSKANGVKNDAIVRRRAPTSNMLAVP